MAKQYKYRKITNEVTTLCLVEPDYELLNLKERVREIGALDGFTYIEVPDSVTLQKEQPVLLIQANFEADKVNAQVVQKIRERYSINDEIKLLRLGDSAEKDMWVKYVEECRAWGVKEKAT
jgi:hypothetical protein